MTQWRFRCRRPRVSEQASVCPLPRTYSLSRDLLQIPGARSLGRVDDVECDLFAFLKGVEIDSGQLGAMKENFVSVIGADETKSAIRDDFLDSASSHSKGLRGYMLETGAEHATGS